MPELPEVEYGRKTAEQVALGRRITKVWCEEDPIVIQEVSTRTLKKKLKGRTIQSVCRKGKYLWFELDAEASPIFHFGMTGAFCVPGETRIQLESDGRQPDSQWPPRFRKIHLSW